MHRRSRLVTFGLPLVALLAGGAAFVSMARKQPVAVVVTPAVAPPTQPGATAGVAAPAAGASEAPARGRGFVGAAGIVEPESQEIAVGAHVSGVVAAVLVKPGAVVKAGAPLFRLDDRAAAAQVAIRRSELAAAESRLSQLLARIPSLTATRDAARASATALKAELDDWADQRRTGETLKSRGDNAISDREVTKRRNSERAAGGRLAEAQARAAQAEAELDLVANPNGAASVDVERANVQQAKAALTRAEVDLDLLTVRAPLDGTVLQVNVRPGEFSSAGALSTPLMVLGNLQPMHVRVDIDEMDIWLFSGDAKAYASLRGQAKHRVPLAFVRVDPIVVPKKSLTGAVSERVDTRVLRVVYALPRDGFAAYSGQQVDVFIEASATASGPVTAEQSPPQPAMR